MNCRFPKAKYWGMLMLGTLLCACSTTGGTSLKEADRPASSGTSFQALPAYDDLPSRAARAYGDQRWAEASRLYGLLSERLPRDAFTWFRLGNAWSRQGAFDRAVLAYQRSIEQNALDPRPWFNLSTAYLMHAQRSLTQAWETMPRSDPARASIEARLLALGDLVQASIGPPSLRPTDVN